jgi:hypothetical protein
MVCIGGNEPSGCSRPFLELLLLLEQTCAMQFVQQNKLHLSRLLHERLTILGSFFLSFFLSSFLSFFLSFFLPFFLPFFIFLGDKSFFDGITMVKSVS